MDRAASNRAIETMSSVSIKGILAHSSKFTGNSLLAKLISFPVTIIVATVLNPSDFGMLAYVGLFTTYASWISTSAFSTAYREMPGLIKVRKLKQANYVQNVALSVDVLLDLLVFFGLITIAALQRDPLIRNVMFVASGGFVLGKFFGYLDSLNFIFQDFSMSAKVQLIRIILNPILVLGLVFIIGIYALPIAGVLVSIVSIVYLLRSKSYHLAFRIDRKLAFRLIRVGFILNLGTILYTLFSGTVDRTIIAAYLSKEDLGLYAFSYNFLALFLNIFRDYGRVLKPIIWASAETASTTQAGFAPLIDMAIYCSIVSAALIGFLQLGFLLLINTLTVKFVGAGFMMLVLACYIAWENIEIFPAMVLYSPRVNKQNIVLYLSSFCVGLNVILDLGAVYLGYGVVGIAAMTTASQSISAMLMYWFSSQFLFCSKREFFNFLPKVLLPLAISACITVVHWIGLKNLGLYKLCLLSFPFQIVCWTLVTFVLVNPNFSNDLSLKMITFFGLRRKTGQRADQISSYEAHGQERLSGKGNKLSLEL